MDSTKKQIIKIWIRSLLWINFIDILVRYISTFFFLMKYSESFIIYYILVWVPIIHDLFNGFTILYLINTFAPPRKTYLSRKARSYYRRFFRICLRRKKRIDIVVYGDDSRKLILTQTNTESEENSRDYYKVCTIEVDDSQTSKDPDKVMSLISMGSEVSQFQQFLIKQKSSFEISYIFDVTVKLETEILEVILEETEIGTETHRASSIVA